ncbi:unnamed protein product [Didymodactylos carnosus]|uniref:THAP-type domain-containing protein n=1 Tax=Didymodactylos carnosus TaxID=1234261 RepID=A0A813RJ64_9BILA|nr:unnamed protein product [Didymodactylos carnosus]CAF1016219.1 unnamed protein product [Didymodactylos carnosus]CAF3566567.1 unnamed protein product [Didymodactylos carnosus]CAF3785299.1 unnamed protein product [Didymodactylos carnosus]
MHYDSWFDHECVQSSKLLSNIQQSPQMPCVTQPPSSLLSFPSRSKRKQQSSVLKLSDVANSKFKPNDLQRNGFSLQKSSTPEFLLKPLSSGLPLRRENGLSVPQTTSATSTLSINVLKNHCAVINCRSQYSDKQKHFYFVPFPSSTPELEKLIRHMKINSERLHDESTGVYICSRHRYPLYLHTHRKPGAPVMPSNTLGIKNGIDHVLFLPKPWHTLCCMNGCINNDLVHRLSSATFVRVPRVPVIQRNAFLCLIGNTNIDQDEFLVCDKHFPMSMRHNNVLTSLAVPKRCISQINQKSVASKLEHTSPRTIPMSPSFEQQRYIKDKTNTRKKLSEWASLKNTRSTARNIDPLTVAVVNYTHPYDSVVTSAESGIAQNCSLSSSSSVSTSSMPFNSTVLTAHQAQSSTPRFILSSRKHCQVNRSIATTQKQETFLPLSPTSPTSSRCMLLLPAQMQPSSIESKSTQHQNNTNDNIRNTTYSLTPSLIYPMQKRLRTIRPNFTQVSPPLTTDVLVNSNNNNSLSFPSNSIVENLRTRVDRKRAHTGQQVKNSCLYSRPLVANIDVNQSDEITTLIPLNRTTPFSHQLLKTNSGDQISARVKSKRQRFPKRTNITSSDNEYSEVTGSDHREQPTQRLLSVSLNHYQSVDAINSLTLPEKSYYEIEANKNGEQLEVNLPYQDKQTDLLPSLEIKGVLCKLCRRNFDMVETYNIHLARKSVIIQYFCLACNTNICTLNPCQAYNHLSCHIGLQDLRIKELKFKQLQFETKQYFTQLKTNDDDDDDDNENEMSVPSWKNNISGQKNIDDRYTDVKIPMRIISENDIQLTISEEQAIHNIPNKTIHRTCMLFK